MKRFYAILRKEFVRDTQILSIPKGVDMEDPDFCEDDYFIDVEGALVYFSSPADSVMEFISKLIQPNTIAAGIHPAMLFCFDIYEAVTADVQNPAFVPENTLVIVNEPQVRDQQFFYLSPSTTYDKARKAIFDAKLGLYDNLDEFFTNKTHPSLVTISPFDSRTYDADTMIAARLVIA